jgi:hypothetical protein
MASNGPLSSPSGIGSAVSLQVLFIEGRLWPELNARSRCFYGTGHDLAGLVKHVRIGRGLPKSEN